eukprot:2836160-Heterocapsa_arctica.AAC.1
MTALDSWMMRAARYRTRACLIEVIAYQGPATKSMREYPVGPAKVGPDACSIHVLASARWCCMSKLRSRAPAQSSRTCVHGPTAAVESGL